MKIILTVDRFEGEMAVLISEQEESIVWPKSKLPNDAKEGSKIFFNLETNEDEKNKSEKKAKEILNEILNIN